MDLTLKRNRFGPYGIFGKLYNPEGIVIAHTLEHAFLFEHEWYPIIPEGELKCIRGKHRLGIGPQFETFEVTGVEGHSGLLFHVGNYNEDSTGCILLGQNSYERSVVYSRTAFNDFMNLQKGVDTFMLKVENEDP